MKPLDGMGGKSIFVVHERRQECQRHLRDADRLRRPSSRWRRCSSPRSAKGDKRILLIDGEPVPYALARIPSDDDNRGNLVMGAVAGKGQPLSRDREICEQVGPVLRDAGVIFAGIDVIGDYLTEVNVTSPTGIRELDRQFDLNIAGEMFDAIESRLSPGQCLFPGTGSHCAAGQVTQRRHFGLHRSACLGILRRCGTDGPRNIERRHSYTDPCPCLFGHK